MIVALIILIVCIMQRYYVNASTQEEVDEHQTGIFVDFYNSQNSKIWPELAQHLAHASELVYSIAVSTATLYTVNASAITSNLNCSVPAYQVMMNNETAFSEVLCCHASIIRRAAPLIKFFEYAKTSIYSSNSDAITTTINDYGIYYVNSIQSIQVEQLLAFKVIMCAQDSRIMVPEKKYLTGYTALDPIAGLVNLYQTLLDQTHEISDCLNVPIQESDCLNNVTMAVAPPTPWVVNLDYDSNYQAVCGATQLSFFEFSRAFPAC
jgi:hypothetical protein